jgi:hypothetical protein
MAETFGSQLAFDAEADWVYPSYYSAAVGFATNPATLTVVEYGPTAAYGTRTSTQDSYYYNHLHYLTDLQPGRAYHYRILAQAKDGQWLTSGDRVVTTKQITPDVVRIPEDMTSGPQYVLTESNKTYLVTRDLTVDAAFIKLRASNVTIDLGGHTVVYDDGEPIIDDSSHYSDDGTFGIHANQWNLHDIQIYNGTLRQGSHGGQGFGGEGYNPINLYMMYGTVGNAIAGVTVDYYGADVDGFSQVSVANLNHNVTVDRGTVVTNRHWGLNAASGTIENASYNSFRRFRQRGISKAKNVIGNEFYSDSYDTNSYAILQAEGGEVAYNKVFGVGYMPIGIAYENRSHVHDNLVYLHGTANRMRSIEYDRLSGITGIRFAMYDESTQNYSGDVGSSIEDLLYEDNTIVLKPWAGGHPARGLWINTGSRSKNTKFLNNIIKLEALSNDLDRGEYRWMSTVSTVDVYGGRHPDDPTRVPPVTLLEGNKFMSNVEFVSFGSNYASGIQNVLFKNNTFEKIEHHSDDFQPFTVSYWYFGSERNRMVDNVAVGWDPATAPEIFGTTFSEAEIASTFNLTLTDTAGAPIASQTVRLDVEGDWTTWHQDGWYPALGEPTEPPDRVNYSATGVTDPQGRMRVELDEYYHVVRVERVQERIDYGPVTVTVPGYRPATVALSTLKADGRIVLTPEDEGPPSTAFGAPHNFAVYTMGADSVWVYWWTGDDVDGTRLYRATSPNGPFELIATVAGEDSYYDSGLPLGVTYYYKAVHYKGAETGPYTATVAKATEPVWRVPNNFQVFRLGHDCLWVYWWTGQDVEGTKVYRSTSPNGPFELIATVTGEDSYSDRDVVPGVTYYYKTAHFKGAEGGAYTEIASGTP